MPRITVDELFMGMAKVMAQRSSCLSRHVGCIIVDEDYKVLSSGFNGPPRGVPHCIECQREESGKGLDYCFAVHAEQNALLQCPNVSKIHTVYVTSSPCITCVKLLMNTTCQRIVYDEEYPDPLAKELWNSVGHVYVQNGWQKFVSGQYVTV